MKQSLINALRKGTQVGINIDSHEIVLTPHLRVKKDGGVSELVPQTPRPPQKFTIQAVEATLSGISGAGGGVTKSEGAELHTWAYELVGAYNAEIAIGDTWKEGETTYRVVGLQPFNNYERRAVVSAIGKDPQYGS